jgi:hypothetical protein
MTNQPHFVDEKCLPSVSQATLLPWGRGDLVLFFTTVCSGI